MSKAVFILNSPEIRQRVIDVIKRAPDGYAVEVKASTRTLEQNARLWPTLTEVSKQVDWHGKKLKPNEWKDIFTAALKGTKVVPGLDGGFVVLGQHTSTMTKSEFSELLELIYAFGAERDVQFLEPNPDE